MTEGRGKFITLEGLEGVGKTTNRQYVESLLDDAQIDFIGTREPGGTPLGESLRDLVLSADGQMQDLTELLLMATRGLTRTLSISASNCVWPDRSALSRHKGCCKASDMLSVPSSSADTGRPGAWTAPT